MKLKICGLVYPENIDEILLMEPDYVGFIFAVRSARYMRKALDPVYARMIDGVDKVGVFVDETEEAIQDAIDQYGLTMVQLHGKESPELCEVIQQSGVGVIKVFSVKDRFDFSVLEPYEPFVDYFLFDTKVKGKLGGTGQTFNWDILEDYPSEVPFFLSGGLSLENIEQVMQMEIPKLHAIDVNSKFEIKPGLKNLDKLRQLKEILA